MSSVSSVTVLSDTTDGNRRTIDYKFELLDNDATLVEREQRVRVNIGELPNYDTATEGPVLADAWLVSLANGEEESGEQDYAQNLNALDLAQNPKWTTAKKKAKKFVLWMLREKDPRVVIWMEPFLLYLKQNYETQQLANWLELDPADVVRIWDRIQAVLEVPPQVEKFKDLLADYDLHEINLPE